MDENLFEKGYDIDSYVRNLRNYRSLVRGLMDEADASDEHATRLKELASGHPQPVHATVTTEDWCGDSALNLPILSSLFGKAGIELRVFRGSETSELKDKYESEGDDHIPVLSLWDGEGAELGRWIEAPKAVHTMKNTWKAERPEFMELYAKQKDDKEAARKFASLYRLFLDEMAGWYRSGMWLETTREVVALLG
ncbi:MAG: thioredoxin family protein [Spirochaetota bacterium]